MSTNKKSQQEANAPEVVIESAIIQTESWIQRNAKTLIITLGAIVLVVCGYLGYKYFYEQPNRENAKDTMFVAEQLFNAGEYQQALDGDGNNAGFLEVISSYGSTPQGNIARHYAGICYLNLGDIDEAYKQLSGYKPADGIPAAIINAQNFGLRGDIMVQKGDYKEALGLYRKAIDASDNPLTSPMFLKKAGLVCEQLGENQEALAFYERITSQYGSSMEARDIDKNIGRVKQLL